MTREDDQAITAASAANLAEHAVQIRRLGRRVIADIIEIGRHLTAAKQLVEHGEWLYWLRDELGWKSEDTAQRFMAVARAFGGRQIPQGAVFDAGALYLLASPPVPPETRDAAIEKAAAGERITKSIAGELIAEARAAPSPVIIGKFPTAPRAAEAAEAAPVARDARVILGALRDFDRLLDREPESVLGGAEASYVIREIRRLAPLVAAWLLRVGSVGPDDPPSARLH